MFSEFTDDGEGQTGVVARSSSNDVDVEAADGEGAAAKKREDRRLGGLEALPWFLMSDILDVVLLRIRDGRCVCACVCYVYT